MHNKESDKFLKNLATHNLLLSLRFLLLLLSLLLPLPLRFLLLGGFRFLPLKVFLVLLFLTILFRFLLLGGFRFLSLREFLLLLLLLLLHLKGFILMLGLLPLRVLQNHQMRHSTTLHLLRSRCQAVIHTICYHKIWSPIMSCYPVTHLNSFIATNTHIGQKKSIGHFSLGLRNLVRKNGQTFQRNLFHQKLQLKLQVMLKNISNARKPQRKRRKEEASTTQP